MKKTHDFDVIIVGSGMSGGWAAKEFCEKGYKTLVLDRGKPLEHGDYKTEGVAPWDMPNRGRVDVDKVARDQATVGKCYAFDEYTQRYFINDRENPYESAKGKRFDWIRSSHVGGKSLLWARQSYRMSDIDFEANKKDSTAIDWPIRYRDIEKWYDYVERFVGISGSYEDIPQLPNSVFQKPIEMNIVEKYAKKKIESAFPGRRLIIGRCAHLTEPTEEQMDLGRGLCLARNTCQRGCSWAGFFSSISATLPAAKRTNNMTLWANSTVQSVLYDEISGKATGVNIVNTITKKTKFISARVIFMCASTLATTQILLNSISRKFPDGLGNSSGVLGHYLMDHVTGSGAYGRVDGYKDYYYRGRRPTGIYIPRFANITEKNDAFKRGFGFQGAADRADWRYRWMDSGIGTEMKASIRAPGSWGFSLIGFGEMLPRFENYLSLSPDKLDPNGIPVLKISCEHSENEIRMKEEMKLKAMELLQTAGVRDVKGYNDPEAKPGIAIHETGTARMGIDPAESYLNKFNQSHDVPNLFVTDGAAFTSSPCQNPSLTFMALTVRAVHYADKQLKEGKL